jgi:hypothetical protein
MAHFALVDDTNTVREVINVGNDDCAGGNFPESEAPGQAFIASCGIQGRWLQTSYHENFRVCYAGIGYSFDPTVGEYGAFVPPPADDGN